jgi:predicted deacylase
MVKLIALAWSIPLMASANATSPLHGLKPPLGVDPSRSKYADVQAYMREQSERHPGNARVFTLGDSDSGRKIEGVALGRGPVKELIVASHHGNEYGSVEVAKGVIASLAEQPLAGMTVYVVPVLNIAGYDGKARRESARGVSYDPNRNYPGPCGTEGPFTLKSTQALAQFIEREGVVTSATLHTFHPAVLYPWGHSAQGEDLVTPYEDIYKQISAAAAIESHYEVGNSALLIYPADGTYEDFAFWKHGIWSLLFELGGSHSPTKSEVEEMVRVNVPGIRRMLTLAPTQRAEKHDFTGKCDVRRGLDRHDE